MRNTKIFLIALSALIGFSLLFIMLPQEAQAQSSGNYYEWDHRGQIFYRSQDGSVLRRFVDDRLDYEHSYTSIDDNGCRVDIHVVVDELDSITAPAPNIQRAATGRIVYAEEFKPAPENTCEITQDYNFINPGADQEISIRKPENFDKSFYWINRNAISRSDDKYNLIRSRTVDNQTLFLRQDEEGQSCQDFMLVNQDQQTGYFEEIAPDGGDGGTDDTERPNIAGDCEIVHDPDSPNNVNGDIKLANEENATRDPESGSPGSDESTTGQDDPKCIAEGGLTWIVCGALNFIADVMDQVEGFIDGQFVTQPLDINDGQDPIRSVWSAFRTLANIAFIIAFFVVIFAQSLSLNIDAYTVKKMLPRLAIGVILVQFSFIISGFLIDITNVLGKGISDLIINAVPSDVKNAEISLGVGDSETVTSILTGSAAVGAGALTLKLLASGAIGALAGTILPVLAIGLLFLIVVFLVIVLRDLLIVVAVILSPLAFVAWILPNTENIFRFWWSSFTKLLLMYPLIMLIFATSKVLAMLTFQVGNNPTGFNIIMALLILIIPLAAVPFTFKVGGTLLGAAYGTATSLASKGQQAARQTGRYAKFKDRTKQRELDLRSGIGVGKRKRFQRVGPKLATGAALSRARGQHKTFEQLGPDVQSAQKRLETLGLNKSLPAGKLLLKSRSDAEEYVAGKQAAAQKALESNDPAYAQKAQEAQDYQTIFNVLDKEKAFGDIGHAMAGAGIVAESSQANSEDLQSIRKNFGGASTYGSKAWSDLKYSNMDKNPHLSAIDYSGQYSKGHMAKALRDTSLDKTAGWSPEAYAYALRDEYATPGQREGIISDDKLNELKSSDRVSNNVKNMIESVQQRHAQGESAINAFENDSFRKSFGIEDKLAPPVNKPPESRPTSKSEGQGDHREPGGYL